jgi:parallel beta-helix repeat protein
VDSTHLYVRLPAGSPPGAHQVTIPRFTTGLTLECSHYQVRGLEFCYYGHGPYHRGIYLHFGCSNLVERCAFHHNGIGVAIKRSASFNTIQHCRFSETPLPEWSWGAVKENGVDYEAGGVYVYGSEIANEGNVIRYNVFEDLFDGCHLYSNDDDPPGPTKNLDFHDNVITRCGDDGLETDGLGSNVRIYGNRWTTCLSGISLAPARIGPVYVFRNVILGWHSVDSHSDGLYEGYPFKFNHSDGGTTPWVFVYHNTCVSDVPGQDAFLFKEYCDWTNVVSRNNIYAGTDHALDCWETPNPVDFDYDDLFTTSGSAFIRWGATDYATLPAFAAGTGREIHGLAVNPGFSDTVAGDFRLRTGSPLIDRGVLIPGVNEDYVGRAPDIGAFEFRHSACGLSRSNSTLFSTWTAISGMVYRLQHREDMRAGTWTNLSPAVTARSWTVVFSNAPPAGRGFYRLLQY